MSPSQVEAQRLKMAYLSVFGTDSSRSPDQRLVWRDVESFCRAYRPSVEAAKDGAYPENNCLYNEGRRSVWLRARGQVLAAQEPAPAPLTVTRRKASEKP